jgi:hypothetical protein
MKWSIALPLAAAMLVGEQSTLGGDKQLPAKQFQFNMRVFEGDPGGSPEASGFRVLGDLHLVALESHACSFASGGQIPVGKGEGVEFVRLGRMLEGKASTAKDGKLRLEMTLSNTTVGERTKERMQIHTESTRTITAIRPGELLKLRWKGTGDTQAWVELSVEEVKR